ncbi:MAG: FUSC family protein [Promicromonosporaceae bacterium]|nr:FUSC family protein [Promicromonosporaceae bacterium]
MNLVERATEGWRRVRSAALPVLQASIAAAFAYQLGLHVLGHDRPFFAAVSAWICLGWSFNRDIRRMIEIAFGVTLGVAMGDVVVRTIGSGWWQIALVLIVSALLARFLDRGLLLTTQAGAQAIIIAGTPVMAGGPYGRALDAALGGLVALTFALLTPYDPRRELRKGAAAGAAALATMAGRLAAGVRVGDTAVMADALERGRLASGALEKALDHAAEVRSRTRLTISRRYQGELGELENQEIFLDRAMNSLRLLARRLRYDTPNAPAHERAQIASILEGYAAGSKQLSQAIGSAGELDAARSSLTATARQLVANEYLSGPEIDLGVGAGLLIFRAVVGDTLQVAGASRSEVLELMPPRTH